MQKSTLSSRIQYERFQNGLDVCIIPTPSSGIVHCLMKFPGGAHRAMENPLVPELFMHTMPTATGTRSRKMVRESLDALGARVSFDLKDTYMGVGLSARKEVFHDALTILMQLLVHPKISVHEYDEVRAQALSALHNSREHTRAQAHIALMRAFYKEGHPHFEYTPDESIAFVHRVQKDDVLTFHTDTFSSVDALVCIAGDISGTYMGQLDTLMNMLPNKRSVRDICVHADRTHVAPESDYTIHVPDKINIDTCLGIPVSLTRDNADFYPLMLGVAILGGSYTSRLFASLRGKQSLTYGAYASLSGMSEGYAGYLFANAIFPHDVFYRGRTALRDEVRTYIEGGVSHHELQSRKTEMVGKYVVGLATTMGLCGALFNTMLWKRSSTYLDEYPDILRAISLKSVNEAIRTHLRYDLAVTSSAGSIPQIESGV